MTGVQTCALPILLTRDGIQHVCEENDLAFPYWFVTKSEYRYGRGQYKLPNIGTQRKVTKEVTKQEYMEAERKAGFRSKFPGEPATSSFGSSEGVNGRIEYVK